MEAQLSSKWLIATAIAAVACAAWIGLSLRTPEPVAAVTVIAKARSTADTTESSYVVLPRQSTAQAVPAAWTRQPQTIVVPSAAVAREPRIDGIGTDPVWAQAASVTTLDAISQRQVTLRSVHTSSRIFFLVEYPDDQESVTHKSFRWDDDEQVYKPVHDREDTFVFKWSMVGAEADLALRHRASHEADVWFWKAWRTNPVGYADDKWHDVSPERREPCTELDAGGAPAFLRRRADPGREGYVEHLPFEFAGAVVSRYSHQTPLGSRADVRAKGRWVSGRWTIEFGRRLATGGSDDVEFAVGGRYLFGISCYEISGGYPESRLYRPMYKTGDVFDRLILEIRGEDNR